MKKSIILLLLLVGCLFLFAVPISSVGRIIKPELSAEYFHEDGEYYIKYNGLEFIGTSLHLFGSGYITLTTLEETAPVWVKIYNSKGDLERAYKSDKVINLHSNKNEFAAYYNGQSIVLIDSENYKITEHKGSSVFGLDTDGNIAYCKNSKILVFEDNEYEINEIIRKIIFYNNKIYVSTNKGLWEISDNLRKIQTGNCLDLVVIDDVLYFSIKAESRARIYKISQQNEIILEKEIELQVKRTHEDISSPLEYSQDNFAHPIGNSYGEIQQYGETAYLHPGVDFLGSDYQEVFAVHDGYVKAILTTGGDPYWRIAIANEDSNDETEGYLYAHLNESSFTVGIGDFVSAGMQIGTLYPWNYYDFTHTHYARIKANGATWQGDWWTVDNPLVDTINLLDDTSPIFVDVIGDEKMVFRSEIGEYLNPQNLTGSFDIITSCYDLANSEWKIDVWEIDVEIAKAENPDVIVYTNFAFAYDFPLDTYGEGSWDEMILNTIYSRDEQLFSIGNYEERSYYQIITNSDGDDVIDETDAANSFNSAEFNDGDYIIKINARDAAGNASSIFKQVTFDNGVNVSDNEVEKIKTFAYPNPAKLGENDLVKIYYSPKFSEAVNIEIYNLRGQKIRTIKAAENESYVQWNGKDADNKFVSEGVYFYKILNKSANICGKITLMK